jgi:tRNA(Ile2) C34 agmatinyltransferase TiaS
MKPYVLVAIQRLQSEGGFPGRKVPPGWLLERIYMETINGGYGKRNPVCPNCNVRRSNSGDCFC